MKNGFRVIDSDLHVIEIGDVYERYVDEQYRDKMARYLGWSPTNFLHWDVQGQLIPPWARATEVIGPQRYLDAPTEHLYRPVRARASDAPSTLEAMDAEGIDIAVVYRTFAHMVVSIYVSNRFRGQPNFRTLNHASSFPLELMLALSAMTVGGVLERFPDLCVAFLEGNCGWLPWWLHRLDDQWHKYGGGESVQLSALPSEYFGRQCFIGIDVDEELLSVVIDELGDENIVMSVDYPHADGPFPHGIETFPSLPGVSAESKRKIMWDNCARLYRFPRSP